MPDARAPREAPFSEIVRVKNGPDCGRSSHLLRSYCDTVRHRFQGFPRTDASSSHTTKPPSQRQGWAPGGSAHVGKQTDTHAARTTGRSGEPKPGGSLLALVQAPAFLLALVSSHRMEASSPHARVFPSDVEACGPGLPRHPEAGCVSTDPLARQGTVGLCPRDSTPQRDWPGASVLPTESSKSWGQGAASSRRPAGVSGKQLRGLRCPARHQEDGRSLLSACQPAGTFGKALGIPTAGATAEQTPVGCCGEHRKGSIGHVTCSVKITESRRSHSLAVKSADLGVRQAETTSQLLDSLAGDRGKSCNPPLTEKGAQKMLFLKNCFEN